MKIHLERFTYGLPGLVLLASLIASAAASSDGSADAEVHAERRALLGPSHWSSTLDPQVGNTLEAVIRQDLRRMEYDFDALASDSGVWSAPNRAQGFRIRVSVDGLMVFPRECGAGEESPPWSLELRTESFGRTGTQQRLGHPSISTRGGRAELDHGALVEWIENAENGLEHGWTIHLRPRGEGALHIGLELCGDLQLRVEEYARSGALVDASGRSQLGYHDLFAIDARGRELEARLVPYESGLGIEIDDSGADYPLTVDPILSGPDWTAESNQAGAEFGYSVASAGDVNGDGYSDVIVGAFRYDNGEWDEGRAFLYRGSASGLVGTASWTAEINQIQAKFGWSVAAGDVNGDGYGDVIVGTPDYDSMPSAPDTGGVFVYLGSASGLATSPAWIAAGAQISEGFGFSIASGNVNGDSFDDLIVGAPFLSNGQTSEGGAFAYHGSAGGLSTSPVWTAEGNQDSSYFGLAVASAGDVNADAYDDAIIGAAYFSNGEVYEGRAFVYQGRPNGLSPGPIWTAESNQDFASFGASVAGAGDVNGDGFGDVLVGAPYFTNGEYQEGRAYTYYGSSIGPSIQPDWSVESNQASAYLGLVATSGDVNGDGYRDVIVGALGYDNGQVDEGRIHLYAGSASGLSTSPLWTEESNQTSAYLGFSAASAGDVNGDGCADVIAGANHYENGQTWEGRAFAYYGDGCTNVGTKYCAANANSTGSPADITASGSRSAAAGNLRLRAAPVPNQNGIFFHAANQIQVPFGNGFLCSTGGTVRGATTQAAGNIATYVYDNSDLQHSLTLFTGATRHFQLWFRDPMGGGALFNTSNAVSIAIFP